MTIKKILTFFCVLFLHMSASAQSCYESTIISPSPFMGTNDEIFKLSDGSLWQVKYEYEYLYEYSPEILICPSRNKLSIKGKMLNVVLLSDAPNRKSGKLPSSKVIESQIDGEFKGWDGETIFKLTNGQIWQQSSYAYTYNYKYSPKVIIYNSGGGFKLQVEGMEQTISVVRLK